MPVAGILNDLKKLKHPKPVYLVGGIVRDLLLEHQTKDIDLVCLKAKTLAVKFGKSSGGSFFPLDEDNEIYRVVLKNNYLVDFAELRGKSIEEDLSLRDFTVDAMAVKLVDGSSLAVSGKDIIDPFCGQEDLRRQVIKMVGTKIFKDDPLRLLRAFRLSACQRFRIDKNTINLLSRQARLIKKVAPERIREELIKILACSDSHIYLEQMDKAGLIEILIPEVKPMKTTARDFYGPNGVWSHTLSGLRYMEEILPQIKKYFPRHADEIIEHLDEKITGEVRRWVILKMAYLLHDFGKPGTHTREGKRSRFYGHELAGVKLAEKILARLHFSKKEIRVITNIIANHMRPGNLSYLPEITDKAIYRYFRDLAEEGLDTFILSLADAYTTEATVIKRKKQSIYPVDSGKHLKGVREIVKRFHLNKKQIVPVSLLNGNEIMRKFSLHPGPQIGKLINELKEAQAQKLVKNKPQAYAYLKNIIDKPSNLP